MDAAVGGNSEMALRVVHSGPNINSVNYDGQSGLHMMAKGGFKRAVEVMLQARSTIKYEYHNIVKTWTTFDGQAGVQASTTSGGTHGCRYVVHVRSRWANYRVWGPRIEFWLWEADLKF